LLSKYKKLNQDLCDLIEDYNLVSFVGLDVQSKNRMAKILKMADTANGFSFVDEDFRKVVMRTTDIG
jgi:hypothetical protein